MSKAKILIILAGFFLIGSVWVVLSFRWHFYPLFQNSDGIYRWRYEWFEHLEIHTDRWCYGDGEAIKLYVSDSEEAVLRLSLFDILGRDTLIRNRTLHGQYQALPEKVSVRGTGWEVSAKIKVETDWPGGWYVLRVENEQFVRHTSVFIRPDSQSVKKLALLLSTNTWNAYNPWGGQSLYSPNYTSRVSFLRPQPLADPYLPDSYENHQLYFQSARKDAYLAALVDSLGYEFDAYPISYLQTHPEWLQRYEVLTISTHAEYWSEEMIAGLNAYLEQGGNFLSFSGNTAAYVSYYDPDSAHLTVFKDVGPNQWKYRDSAGFRPFGTEYSYDGFHSYAPYEVLVDSSWVWAGTGLQKGDLIGERSDTYDFTHMADSRWDALRRLFWKGRMGAASGVEIDKIYIGTPDNFVHLAVGLNPKELGSGEVYPDEGGDWTQRYGADMGYYEHPGGGLVYNAGSVAFTGAIPYDRDIRQIIANLLERCLGSKD
jgi:N,N-dimethylformamidase